MIAAMAGFTLEDVFIKLLSDHISTGQIMAMLGVGGAVAFAMMAKSKGHALFAREFWTYGSMGRTVAEAVAAVAFLNALALVPLSTVAAVFQVTPLVITMGAAVFLKEAVGWRRWAAIFVGFIGVTIIIRPGQIDFDPNVLLVLVAVISVTARDLITRRLPASLPTTVVSFQAYLVIIFVGFFMVYFGQTTPKYLDQTEVAYTFAMIIFSVAGYYGIVSAMRVGEASVVTPFRYSRLLFSLLMAFIVFNERPDMWTLLGAFIVIATGIYTVLREHRLAKIAAPE